MASRMWRGAWVIAGVVGMLGFAGAARAGVIVSYVMTAGVSGYGTNGAGYSGAVLAAPWELRFAYDTRMNSQVGANNTTTYSPSLAKQVLLQLHIGNDTYAVGPGAATGVIGVMHPTGSATDTLTTQLSHATPLYTMQLSVKYPTVVAQSLPMSLPGSSFQFDPNFSSFRLTRATAQDFYDFDLGNLRPALNPFCPPDFNMSGTLEIQDIFDFLNAWFAGNALADFNGGGLAVQDIFDFLNAWFGGCA